MKAKRIFYLFLFVALPLLAGALGSLFTTPAISGWYAGLARPALAPPNWVFGPVWTTLFILMGVAAFLVWDRGWGRREVKVALAAFAGQLALNVGWSYLFFGRQSPGAALLEIVALWLAIVLTALLFFRIRRPAAWLLLPYLLWVSFASYLNFAFWRLN